MRGFFLHSQEVAHVVWVMLTRLVLANDANNNVLNAFSFIYCSKCRRKMCKVKEKKDKGKQNIREITLLTLEFDIYGTARHWHSYIMYIYIYDRPKQLKRYDKEKFTNDLNEICFQQNVIIIAMFFYAFAFLWFSFFSRLRWKIPQWKFTFSCFFSEIDSNWIVNEQTRMHGKGLTLNLKGHSYEILLSTIFSFEKYSLCSPHLPPPPLSPSNISNREYQMM